MKEKEKLSDEVSRYSEEVARLQQMLVAKEMEITEIRNKQVTKSVSLASKLVDVGSSLMFQPVSESSPNIDQQGQNQNYFSLPVASGAQRPRSVPALEKNFGSRPISRHVHTSPAFVSADKVMQSFRARSALLQSRLEDSDVVMVKSAESGSSIDGDGNSSSPSARGNEPSRKGTYRVSEGRRIAAKMAANASPTRGKELTGKAAMALAESRDRASQLNNQLGDLQTQIRLKEQLIAQLVKSGRETDRVAQEQAEIIKMLQRDKEQTAAELKEMNFVIEKMEQQRLNAAENVRSDYEQKLDAAKKKMAALKKKQAEATEKASNISKLDDLKTALANLKQQQVNLQKRLKEEMDTKMKLEKAVEKDHVKIKMLEQKSHQQEKMLKQRADQLASARRRGGKQNQSDSDAESQRQWLESEVEKVTTAREHLRQVEQQLASQQELLAKREAMVSEKEKLILRKMRNSQMISQELTTMEEDEKLQIGRAQLNAQRQILSERLASGMVLSAVEERRLSELEEAIDAIDQAIEYRRESVGQAQAVKSAEDVRQSIQVAHEQLKVLHGEDARQMLVHLFDRIVELRDLESKSRLEITELQTQLHERDQVVRTLETALHESKVAPSGRSFRASIDEQAQRLSKDITRDIQSKMKATEDLKNRIVMASNQSLNKRSQQENLPCDSMASQNPLNVSSSAAVDNKSSGMFLGANLQPNSSVSKNLLTTRTSEVTLISSRRTPQAFPAATAAAATVSTEIPSNASTIVENPPSTLLTPVRVSRRGLRELSPSTIEARKRQQQQQQSASFSVVDSLDASNATNK